MKENEIRKLEMKVGINEHIASMQCRYCKNVFARTAYATRHMNICPCKETYKLDLLEKLNDKMKGVTSVTNNNNTTNNITNNIINVNSLGNENIDYITPKVLKQLWKTVKSDEEGFAKTLLIIHGNKDHPENHNIVYTNLRANTCLVKRKNSYEYSDIHDVLKDVSENILDMIVLNANFDDVHKVIKQRYENVCDDDEMNQKAAYLAKLELYNGYKKGDIRKPQQPSVELAIGV